LPRSRIAKPLAVNKLNITLNRKYYSIRTGKNTKGLVYTIDVLQRLLKDTFVDFEERGYFQEYFGFYCIDAGDVDGILGSNVEARIFRSLKKENLWPILENYKDYSEDDVFDMIEFLYDHVSKPIDGTFHSYNQCGWHYESFNRISGRNEFRQEVNTILEDYSDGFILTEKGEIFTKENPGIRNIFYANIKTDDPENIDKRLELAISKFRRHRASSEERRDAVRMLADILEYMRPSVKKVLKSKDEADLFNIANNYGIRHHNKNQKTDYDEKVWLSWMFYFYISTIYTCITIVGRE
jgi:hypothetical protein